MADVSVVIPTEDRLPYLRQAIPMFLSHPEVREVIVVVDGCLDGTLDYIKAASAADARIRYHDNIQNKGLPYSRSKGIELACYEYVFTGEDDLEPSGGESRTRNLSERLTVYGQIGYDAALTGLDVASTVAGTCGYGP